MLTAINKYIKEQINKLTRENRKELINFAIFLRKEKG